MFYHIGHGFRPLGMFRGVVLIGLAVGLLSSSPAAATTLTFDDLPPTQSIAVIPDGYGGLTWTNMWYIKGPAWAPGTGYDKGRVSGDYTAFNGYGDAAAVSAVSFDFNSAWLTAALTDGLNVNVKGFLGATEKYDTTVVVNTSGPTKFTFNYLGIDSLVFASSPQGQGYQFAMDNFTFNETSAVPLPSAVWGGLALIGLMAGKKTIRRAIPS